MNATLRHHIEQFAESDPTFVQKMKDGFYVDDLVSGGGGGGKVTDEVTDLYEKAKTRMATGGFKLRKWLTNDAALRKHIGEHESASDTKQVTRLDDFETYVQTSLGIPQDNSCRGVNYSEKSVRRFLGLENPGNFPRDAGIFSPNLRDFGIFSADFFEIFFPYFFSPNFFRNFLRHIIRRILLRWLATVYRNVENA